MENSFDLIDFTFEIFDISNANKNSDGHTVDYGVGRDMFITNLAFGEVRYAGADTVNYEELGKVWNSYDAVEQASLKNRFSEFVGAYRYKVAKAYNNRDIEALKAIITVFNLD